jgi:hypothetical protein
VYSILRRHGGRSLALAPVARATPEFCTTLELEVIRTKILIINFGARWRKTIPKPWAPRLGRRWADRQDERTDVCIAFAFIERAV